MKWPALPPLQTERLELRLPGPDDLGPAIAFGQSERTRFIGGRTEPFGAYRGVLASIGHWTLRDYGMWAVHLRETGEMIGRIGVIFHDFPGGWTEPELGWQLFDGFEGKGYALEAARAAKADYHARITRHPLISHIDPKNTRSAALARRMGAEIEGERLLIGDPVQVWRHTGPEDLA
ncbi:GNAT family N-acetyltransferase [Pseudoroseicyclus sp. CXY001]|uniref:GNAT family N-acetyltransferase n=1 Tax=Pseudoroseicyclus sp. CXY001 TaxID=3242492 RepID=UPI003570EBFC